ncbi:MAG: transposase [Solirubrobacteraceae bacterium]
MQAVQVEQLWDEVLPVQVRVLPADLAVIDQLLDDPVMLAPIARFWQADAAARGTLGVDRGRPTIAMQTYVRIMIVRQRTGWGYETAMREISDSLHLRRFCRIAIDARVPDESTVRKLTRRLGPEVVAEISRAVIGKAARETRFVASASG